MIRIGKLGLHKASGLWFVRIDGKPRYLGRKGGSREEAEALLAVIVAEHAVKVTPASENDAKLTIADMISYYKLNSELDDRNRIRYLDVFVQMFGKETVSSLLPFMIERWLKTEATWSDTTKACALKHLAACFNWLRRNRIITINPLHGVNRPQETCRGEEYVISAEEYNRLLPLLRPTYVPIVKLLWLTGARPSEILGVTADEYLPAEHVIRKIKHKTVKKGKIRKIPLSPTAEIIVQEAVAKVGTGLLFRSRRGNPISSNVLQDYLQQKFLDAGITHPAIPYSFRHSAAVRWIEAKIPLHQVAAWLGDTVATVEKHYVHTIERVGRTVAIMPE